MSDLVVSKNQRTTEIDRILTSRSEIAKRTDLTREKIRRLRSELESIKSLYETYRDNPAFSAIDGSMVTDQLGHFIDHLTETHRKFDQLYTRFSRKTVNIGVVGNAGQGKSTFLRGLTGLSDNEIPTSNRGDCTGAAMIIENRVGTDVHAKIEFYQESDFLKEVIKPYYVEMKLPVPLSLSSFDSDFDTDIKEIREKQTHYEEVKYLERLHNGLKEYRTYLGKSDITIEKSEIRSYTAKCKDDGETKQSIWAAVKMAKVFCNFSNLEGEKIAVGDTPGLGDRSVAGAEDKLMKDFTGNIDAVIMLRKVRERGIRKEDIRLFQMIREAVPEIEAAQWTYFLVNLKANETDQDSLQFLPDDLKNSALKNLADHYFEIDCSQTNAVLETFGKILSDIAGHLGELDKTLYETLYEKFKQHVQDIRVFVKELESAVASPREDRADDNAQVGQQFQTLWRLLLFELEKLKNTYKNQVNTENGDGNYMKSLDDVRKKLENEPWTPPKEQISVEIATDGPQAWCAQQLSKIRYRLSEVFEDISNQFRERFELLRNEAKDHFCTVGKLQNVLLTSKEQPDWWLGLEREINSLPEVDDQIQVIPKMVRTIEQFRVATLSFREFMRPRIRGCFNTLDSNNKEAAPYNFVPGDTEQDMMEKLGLAVKKAFNDALVELEKLRTEPGMALFAAIEEFSDSMKSIGGAESAKEVWREFYYAHRSEVWSDVFKTSEANRKLVCEWRNTIKRLKTICDENE